MDRDQGVRVRPHPALDADGQPKGVIPSNRWGGRFRSSARTAGTCSGVAADAIALVKWDFPGGKEVARYTFDEPAMDHVYVRDFALSADGRRLAAFTQTVNRPGAGRPGGRRGTLAAPTDRVDCLGRDDGRAAREPAGGGGAVVVSGTGPSPRT